MLPLILKTAAKQLLGNFLVDKIKEKTGTDGRPQLVVEKGVSKRKVSGALFCGVLVMYSVFVITAMLSGNAALVESFNENIIQLLLMLGEVE